MPSAEQESGQPLTELMAIVPFAVMLGMELVSATAEEVIGRLDWREELGTVGGALHGGALMSLADNDAGRLVAQTTQAQTAIGP
jgi:1,4-dihydroxy-2-naphthoyl-CoA hydrolase